MFAYSVIAASKLREVLAGEVGDHGGEGADLAGCGLRFGAALDYQESTV